MLHDPVAVVPSVPRGPAGVRDTGTRDIPTWPHGEVGETGDILHSPDQQLGLERVVGTSVEHGGPTEGPLVHVRVDVGHELLEVRRVLEHPAPVGLVGIRDRQRIRAGCPGHRQYGANDVTKLAHRSP